MQAISPPFPRMKRHFTLIFSLLTLASVGAQDETPGVPALSAIHRLQERFGTDNFDRLFEMTGSSGDPQPTEWRVTAVHLLRSVELHEYWADGRRATDEGANEDYYPEKLPKGFFRLSRVKLDSTQAFAVTEQVARDAHIGFDSINYKLHGREYNDEPVWTLTLMNRDEEVIGSVHLSADSGDVLRTVWVRNRQGDRWRVQDSAAGNAPRPSPSVTGNRERPAGEPEPAPPPSSPRRSRFGNAESEPLPPPLPDPEASEPPSRREPTPAPPKKLPTRPLDPNTEVPEVIKVEERLAPNR